MQYRLQTLAFAYDLHEDRILAIVNPEQQPWACWVTRRLALATLHETGKFIVKTSPLARHAAPAFRAEISAFEREAAMANTAKSVRNVPFAGSSTYVSAARRADRLTITSHADKFKIELFDSKGDAAGAVIGRADLQRIMQMLDYEVRKAGWIDIVNVQPIAPGTDTGRSPGWVRH
jgi:hypothetical protein